MAACAFVWLASFGGGGSTLALAQYQYGEPAPSGTGAGASGGAGGAGADLAVTKSASVQTAATGDTIQYRIEVRLKNPSQTSGVTRAVVTDALPPGVTLVSTRVNRGPGCTGVSTVTCDLDFLAGDLVGVVEVGVRVTLQGTLVNTVSVRAPEPDPDTSNNSASVTVRAPQQAQRPVPAPATTAPKLTHRRPAAVGALRASRKGRVASVSTQVAVDKKATVVLSVRDPRTGRKLTLQPGTRIADTVIKRKADMARARLSRARTFPLRVQLRADRVSRNKGYHLVLTATGVSGKSSTLTIRFRG